jgi:alpha-glucosidase
VRVYAAPESTAFTLYEDDGETVAYQGGAVRATVLSQALDRGTGRATVTIGAAEGTYAGAPASRACRVELVLDGDRATGVTLNGVALPEHRSQAAFEAAATGWVNADRNLILARSETAPVSEARRFVFTLRD